MGKNTGLRILLADGDARVRSALLTLLAQETEPIEARECPDIGCLAVEVQGFEPDVIFLDWELPGRPASALLFGFHGLESKPKVIVLSARPETEQPAMTAGADAFVSKGESPERLLTTFRELVSGLSRTGIN